MVQVTRGRCRFRSWMAKPVRLRESRVPILRVDTSVGGVVWRSRFYSTKEKPPAAELYVIPRRLPWYAMIWPWSLLPDSSVNEMRSLAYVIILAISALCSVETYAQIPTLPAGAKTHWIVGQPEEIVAWVVFDPATVKRRLPSALRFITVGELASAGIGWAAGYLSDHPGQGHWGISFIEIVRMKTFTIDGHSPDWPEHGAAALWFARVASSDPDIDLGPGQPFLALEFWMPDRAYVAAIREKGHYATYGTVGLNQDDEGRWRGTIDGDGLKVVAECTPTGPVAGGAGAAGMQAIFPPRSSEVTSMVRVAFAGHRVQECDEGSVWTLQGSHPAASGVVLEPAAFQYGYDLIGGAYAW